MSRNQGNNAAGTRTPSQSIRGLPSLSQTSSRPSNLALPSGMAGSRRKMRVDVASTSMERNLITVERAMADFLLTAEDLEGLRRTTRRSPYATSPQIVVLSRKDVVQRSNEKWGSPEKLKEELERQKNLASSKRVNEEVLRRLPRLQRRREVGDSERHQGLCGSTGRVVVVAILMNGCNLVLKVVAWHYTRSHSMFSECLHSIADMANQMIIAIGVHTSTKSPSVDHPYGFSNMKFVTALISGVGIFCVGTGLSLYHGLIGLLEPSDLGDLTWAFVVMGISGLTEVTTLSLAVRALWISARRCNTSPLSYVWASQDPSVNVVLMEDLAAVLSLAVAVTCLLISDHTGSSVADAVGSLLVGLLLGAVAVFIITTNVGMLVGRSISKEELQQINAELEADVMVRAILDVKGIDMGNNLVRYKAELDFDGRQLARAYLDRVDMASLHEAVKNIKTTEELEDFMLEHGENLVDMLGGQIDRIERKIKTLHPTIRHCDLEIL